MKKQEEKKKKRKEECLEEEEEKNKNKNKNKMLICRSSRQGSLSNLSSQTVQKAYSLLLTQTQIDIPNL